MITVSTKRLMEAIEEADAFRLPAMSAGTEYLYENFCGRLSRGEDVTLSSLEFNAFALEDMDEIRELYANILEPGEYRAEGITRSLRELEPVTAACAFV